MAGRDHARSTRPTLPNTIRSSTVGILAWSIIDMSEVNNTYWSIIGGVRYYDTNIMGVGNVFIVGWGG